MLHFRVRVTILNAYSLKRITVKLDLFRLRREISDPFVIGR